MPRVLAENRAQKSRRNVMILKEFLKCPSHAYMARKYGLARESIAMLLKRLTGKRAPTILDNYNVDWEGLNMIRVALKISHCEIERLSGRSGATISGVFNEDPKYMKGPASVEILGAFLQIAQNRAKAYLRLPEMVSHR